MDARLTTSAPSEQRIIIGTRAYGYRQTIQVGQETKKQRYKSMLWHSCLTGSKVPFLRKTPAQRTTDTQETADPNGPGSGPGPSLSARREKKLAWLSICAYHPCAGATLMFSVSFEFCRIPTGIRFDAFSGALLNSLTAKPRRIRWMFCSLRI